MFKFENKDILFNQKFSCRHLTLKNKKFLTTKIAKTTKLGLETAMFYFSAIDRRFPVIFVINNKKTNNYF